MADDGAMRAAVGKAISTTRTSRLPRLLFTGAQAHGDPTPSTSAPSRRAVDASLLWLFVPSHHGYSIAEYRSAGRLGRGALVELDGFPYRVALVAPSPFLDGRRCAYLEPASPRA